MWDMEPIDWIYLGFTLWKIAFILFMIALMVYNFLVYSFLTAREKKNGHTKAI